MPDMQVVLYEDGLHRLFGPLTLLRSEFDLRCGALLLREKIERRLPNRPCVLLPRSELKDLVAEECPGRGADALGDSRTLLLSGRVVADDRLVAAVSGLTGERVLTAGGRVVGAVIERDVRARVRAVELSGGEVTALGLGQTVELPARVASYPWELVQLTAAEISADAPYVGRLGVNEAVVQPGAHLIEPGRMILGSGSEIGAGAVLDARAGEILIGRDVVVMPHATIAGPAAIGNGSIVKVGAKIYGGTSIGPTCKVGGEIEGSTLHSFSNKQHEGFLGHSYVGSWANLGAATDTSDLKNNYSPVTVEIGGAAIDTGSTFVGSTIGDHTKTAIGTKLTTGAVVGVFCNVISFGFAPKSLPSFSWGTPEGYVVHDIEKAIETARRVMARRGVALTPALESIVRRAFDAARGQRAGELRA
jgi:UDP-N-acetylglucosamine diphosphorylase/glucosamine-1-phosphate N-acetyltransferase